jgi:translocator protein
MKINLPRLVLSIFVCSLAGVIGSVFTVSSVTTWYQTLIKPFFNPPAFVFGPVWTVLYLLMGVSLYQIWGKKKANLKWFWAQLTLNTAWSIVFFGLKNPPLALVVIVLLLISIILTIKSFLKVNKNAALLLLPYLAWVSFASILNLSIVILNSGVF